MLYGLLGLLHGLLFLCASFSRCNMLVKASQIGSWWVKREAGKKMADVPCYPSPS